MSDVLDGIRRKARDHARNPMQWSSSPNAGFSLKEGGEKPWMRVHDDYVAWNVEKQKGDPNSVLSFWKKMLMFRKRYLSSVSTMAACSGFC
jgi:oligo-1,6-glucosidase